MIRPAVLVCRRSPSPVVSSRLAAAGLSRQKWPESIHQIDEFPRTPSGKVQKFRLRQWLGGPGPGPGDPENIILPK